MNKERTVCASEISCCWKHCSENALIYYLNDDLLLDRYHKPQNFKAITKQNTVQHSHLLQALNGVLCFSLGDQAFCSRPGY